MTKLNSAMTSIFTTNRHNFVVINSSLAIVTSNLTMINIIIT